MDDYFTYSLELVPEGRRAFCLDRAVQASHDHMTAEQILDAAKVYEVWLKEAETKSDAIKTPRLKAVAKSE